MDTLFHNHPAVMARSSGHRRLRTTLGPVDEFEIVNRGRRLAAQVKQATDVSRCDHVRRHRGNIGELSRPQCCRDLRLKQAIGSRRSAAEMAFWNGGDLEAGAGEKRLWRIAEPQRILRRAGRVEGNPQWRWGSSSRLLRQELRNIAELSRKRFGARLPIGI